MVEHDKDKLFEFKEDADQVISAHGNLMPWKILSVEDDETYQQVLSIELAQITIMGRKVELLVASSAEEAANLFTNEPDIAVVLLDVVMETDDAGLRLIGAIRNAIGNASVRIVLLTGQPGMAPRMDVMEEYDVHEYWNKADLTFDQLRATLTGNIRSWLAFRDVEQSRVSLQLLLTAAKNISPVTNIENFSSILLTEIVKLTNVDAQSIVCANIKPNAAPEKLKVIAASGDFLHSVGVPLKKLIDEVSTYIPNLEAQITTAINDKTHLFDPNVSVLYFDTIEVNGFRYLMIVNSKVTMTQTQVDLLRVFCENIHDGFQKIGLLSRLNDLAYNDDALHIPNRNWLLSELAKKDQYDKNNSVLVFFKISELNDIELSIGHLNCVNLLIQYSRALRADLPSSRSISRITYDTFILEFNFDKLPTDAMISAAGDQNLLLGDTFWNLSAKIMLMPLSRSLEDSPESILSYGKAAFKLLKEKAKGLNHFDQELKDTIRNRQEMIFDLSTALQRDEFFIVLQPKVRLKTKSVVGFEALIRWRRFDGTIVPPDQFIPVAESSGLISEIDCRTLDMTINAAKMLSDAGYPLRVSFNATSHDLLNKVYVQKLLTLYKYIGVPANLLEIEVTESMAMESYATINPLLKRLIQLGFSVSIDDFGTGYSSLSHIQNMAATHLKIDRSFVDEMVRSKEGEDIADIVLRIGQQFNFSVIAEGIETTEQHEKLLEKGCEYGQGYLFAKPMPLDELFVWLENQSVETNSTSASTLPKN